jgi:hypothetical protein
LLFNLERVLLGISAIQTELMLLHAVAEGGFKESCGVNERSNEFFFWFAGWVECSRRSGCGDTSWTTLGCAVQRRTFQGFIPFTRRNYLFPIWR